MKRPKMKVTEQRVRNAAIVLGAASWQSRLEKFGPQELREQLSRAGRLGGRPRKEDPQSVAK